uniref:RRM domain-containing protein n=1 Tax=Rhabditophanes sp. KR3021 TaxID=114890 RepID=A0AC35TYQ3_9BILA
MNTVSAIDMSLDQIIAQKKSVKSNKFNKNHDSSKLNKVIKNKQNFKKNISQENRKNSKKVDKKQKIIKKVSITSKLDQSHANIIKNIITPNSKSQIKEVFELEVANIPFNVSKKDLEVLFKGYKVNIAIKLGKNNKSTGICNLVAKNKVDITKIMKDFKGVSIDKRVLKLTMKVNPKNVKQAKPTKPSVKINTTKSVEDMDKELQLYMNATV